MIKNLTVDFIEKVGRTFLETIEGLGRFFSFNSWFFYWLLKKPYRFKLLFDQLYFIGNKSIAIVCLTGSFTGMVMAYQTYFGFKLVSPDPFIGPLVAISLAKELGPVLTGLIVTGRAGSAMAAQIGSMKVTEQVDALEVMGVSSYQYLALPRIIASTLSLPMLCALFVFIGNLGAYTISMHILEIESVVYFSRMSELVFIEDIFQGLIKAFVFGFVISCIGTYFGFSVENGAEGVGRGTNKAVVWGMVVVLILDFFLTSFLIHILY